MAMAGFGVTEVNSGYAKKNNSNKFKCMMEKVKLLDKSVSCVSDMLSVLKGQSGAENMVVEISGEVFKVEADVRVLGGS
eukprot:9890271-Ditylum_brightwellii.AAC.1